RPTSPKDGAHRGSDKKGSNPGILATAFLALSGRHMQQSRACGAGQTAASRSLALQEELQKHGISFEELDRPPHDPLLYPAIRCCRAFICPNSEKALRVANRPGRAKAVAAGVVGLLRSAEKEAIAWEEELTLTRQSRSQDLLPLTLVIDCVRSTQNVTSLLETCAMAGVGEVVFCGITPAPPMYSILRRARAAAAQVPSSYAVSGKDAVLRLQASGFCVWALETTTRAAPLERLELPSQPLALIVGNEKYGVSVDALECCDEHVCITTVGIKNSLNVAVAG
ncbi:trmH, partial [Symbiodinium pilosum]